MERNVDASALDLKKKNFNPDLNILNSEWEIS